MRVDPASFERAYAAIGDPWDFAHSPYEQRRFDLTIAALRKPRYRNAVEPACAGGALTERLARRADRVVAFDASPTAVGLARRRLAGVTNVELSCAVLPEQWPHHVTADLVVLSELGYYFDADTWTSIITAVRDASRGAELVAVHWRGHSADHLRHGDEVHDDLRAVLGAPQGSWCEPDFRIDTWNTP